MEYELTKDCRFGKVGKIVSYGTYLSANITERETCFKAKIKPQDHYNASESHGIVSDDDLRERGRMNAYDTDDTADVTSSLSSSPSREDNFDFGDGSFGGGGASSDYEDTGYGGNDDYSDNNCGDD